MDFQEVEIPRSVLIFTYTAIATLMVHDFHLRPAHDPEIPLTYQGPRKMSLPKG